MAVTLNRIDSILKKIIKPSSSWIYFDFHEFSPNFHSNLIYWYHHLSYYYMRSPMQFGVHILFRRLPLRIPKFLFSKNHNFVVVAFFDPPLPSSAVLMLLILLIQWWRWRWRRRKEHAWLIVVFSSSLVCCYCHRECVSVCVVWFFFFRQRFDINEKTVKIQALRNNGCKVNSKEVGEI